MASNRTLILIFLSSLAVRLLIFFLLLLAVGKVAFILGDTVGYVGVGQNWLNGHGFSAADAAGNFYLQDFRPPLYAIFAAASLAATNDTLLLVIIQIICASLIPVLTYQLGREFISHRASLILAAVLAISEPLLVFFSFFLLSDIFFLFFFMLALLFGARFLKSPSYWLAGLTGITLGLATLIRGIGEFFAIYFVLFTIWQSFFEKSKFDLLKKLALFVLLFILVISPWVIRNYKVFGNLSVSSEGPWLLHFDLAPSLYSINYKMPFYEARKLLDSQLRNKYTEKELLSSPNRIRPSILIREGIDLTFQQWRGIPKLFLVNALWFFTHDNWAYHLVRFGVLPERPRDFSPTYIFMTKGLAGVGPVIAYLKSVYFIPLIARLFWFAVSLLAFWGAVARWRGAVTAKEKLIIAFLAGTVVYFFLISSVIGFAGEGRIRLPVMPILFLFAAYGFLRLKFNYVRL